MQNDQRIEELQKQIDNLSSDMQHYHQRLLVLQQELDRLQNKDVRPDQSPVAGTHQNFKLENFIGLRVIHLVGIVVLVIGLSIGVKYAIDKELISEGFRITLAYSAGIILYLLSLRLKKKYQFFSAILFSGAMASLYFTTYAAFVYYGFFSFTAAFSLMTAFTIYTAFESLRYDRQEIAVLGMVGAYGIPFLISANSERVELFFSYIILINIGIVYLSFKKRWRTMGQLALLTSWTLFIVWGFRKYQENDFNMGIVFIIIFYSVFTLSAFAHRMIRAESLTIRDIQQLTINNIALYLSALIIFGHGDFGFHLAPITGGIGIFVLLFSVIARLILPSEIILQQSMALQTVILVSLFIGFNWSGLLVTLLWVALAVTLFVFGIYNHRSWPRLAAILLMSVTLGKLIIFDSSKFSTIQKIVAYIVIGALLLMLSFLYQKYKNKIFYGSKD
ncbi:MAG TPA: DUF2339 domain-containing protein [Chitinophagaceae bacterium]